MAAGHRILPHTADLALEAWAPTRQECIAQAVAALVESFADVTSAVPRESVALALDEASDEDLLVAVLNEVIYQMEVYGRVPVDVSIDGEGQGRTDVRFAAVPVEDVDFVGAIPKAVSLHELQFAHSGGGWRCHVTVDV